MTENKAKGYAVPTLLLFICVFTLFNPNYNTIDIFPDFIGYLILTLIAMKYERLVPYFSEAKSALSKLLIITAAKLPAMLIMLSWMRSGRDIVPLFAFVFATLELIFLLPAIDSIFSAIYYVGERNADDRMLRPFKVLGISMTPLGLRSFTKLFAISKAALSVLPELCLLTFENATVTLRLREIYPILAIICLCAVLLIGLVWAIACFRYVLGIIKGGFHESALSVAAYSAPAESEEEKNRRISEERVVRGKLFSLSLFFFATLFTFDLTFSEFNYGVNIIPHSIFALIVLIIGLRLFSSRKIKISLGAVSLGYVISSLVTQKTALDFFSVYSYLDLLDFSPAMDSYIPYEIAAAVELFFFAALIALFTVGFYRFICENIGLLPEGDALARQSRELRRSFTVKGIIMSVIPLLLLMLKTLSIILKADVQLIYFDTANTTMPAIAASPTPWLDPLIFALGICYVIFAYLYIADLKGEVKLKYSNEKQSYDK